MTPARFLAAPALLWLGACQSPAPSLSQAQRDSLAMEVRTVVEELTAAMNAHDAEAVMGFYQDSEEFIYVGCTDLMFGSAFYKVIAGPSYRAQPAVTFQRDVLQVQILAPTSAVVTLQGSSSRVPALFWTQVMTREPDGRWLIVHEHESWPACDPPPAPHPGGAMPDSVGEF